MVKMQLRISLLQPKTMPLIKISGKKTAELVRTEVKRGMITSCVPSTQEVSKSLPSSRCCSMFSMTIIALSMISPMPKTKPVHSTNLSSFWTLSTKGSIATTSSKQYSKRVLCWNLEINYLVREDNILETNPSIALFSIHLTTATKSFFLST